MKRFAVLMMAGLLALCAPEARAEGFGLYDWGSRASGLANGMVGRADDASAVAHNPAGITQLPGTQLMAGVTMITPKMLIDTEQGGKTTTSRVMRHYYFTPHAFVTQQINDRVWFGFGTFVRFGLGNQYPDNWPGTGNLQDVKLQTVSFNPNLAFKVTDQLSLALGIEAMTVRMKMHKTTSATLPVAPGVYRNFSSYQELTGKNTLGIGFNAALHYRFNDQWAAGLTYRSGINHKVKGDTVFYAYPMSALNCSLKGNFRVPDHISAGVTYKPLPNLSFEVGTVYTVWSRFRNFNIMFANPAMNGQTSKNWRDTWQFNASVEYLPLDWLALRLGYSFETSPIPASTADYMVETNGRRRYSCGVGFIKDAWTLDFSYSMLRSRELDYYEHAMADPRSGVLPGKSHHGITHEASVSVGYKF